MIVFICPRCLKELPYSPNHASWVKEGLKSVWKCHTCQSRYETASDLIKAIDTRRIERMVKDAFATVQRINTDRSQKNLPLLPLMLISPTMEKIIKAIAEAEGKGGWARMSLESADGDEIRDTTGQSGGNENFVGYDENGNPLYQHPFFSDTDSTNAEQYSDPEDTMDNADSSVYNDPDERQKVPKIIDVSEKFTVDPVINGGNVSTFMDYIEHQLKEKR